MKCRPCCSAAILTVVLVSTVIPSRAAERYSVKGLLLKVDAGHKTMIVSSDAIPNYMEAMTMPFSVRDSKELEGVLPGSLIDFTLVVEGVHPTPKPSTCTAIRASNQTR